MQVVYALEPIPAEISQSIFLAGPTPRSDGREAGIESWRVEALKLLEDLGYDGTVFVPEPKDKDWAENYDHQITWERICRIYSDVIVYWVEREIKYMPAFTTNVEFGDDFKTGKMFYGRPDSAPKTRYLDSLFKTSPRDNTIHSTLIEVLTAAVNYLDGGAFRRGGEALIPLHIWKTKQFQSWYTSHKNVGNSIIDAEVLNTFWIEEDVFSFMLWVNLWIAREQRSIDNEFVFSRTDTCSVVAFYDSGEEGEGLDELEVVL